MFFVLSGFLISSILIQSRGEEGAWLRFYERRALRILPPYVAFLLLATCLLHLHWEHKQLWYAFFAMNIAEVLHVGVPGLGILWSLAVEEQFYLFWPLVALRSSPRVVLRWAAVLIVLAPVLRGFTSPFLHDHTAIYYLMPFRMDLLAAGAVMAVLWRKPGDLVMWRRWGLGLTGSGLAVLLLCTRFLPAFRADSNTIIFNTVGYSLICCVAAGLIAFTLGSEGGWYANVMAWRPLRWVGTISYTGYLSHVAICVIVTPFSSLILNRALAFAIVLAYGSVSWFFLEKPILKARPTAWLAERRVRLHAAASTEYEKA